MFKRYQALKISTSAASLLLAVLCVSGCQHSGSYDLPHGYIPHPAGTSQNIAFNMQASKGEATKFIIYSNRFVQNTVVLSPKGQSQVDWIVENISTKPFPVIVEPSGNPKIDEQRRAALVDYFTLQGIPDSENFIIVKTPEDTFVPVDQVTN